MPSFSTSARPTGKICRAGFTPAPVTTPRGYRIADGPSSVKAVFIMSASSFSSLGAISTRSGTDRRYPMSNSPWCVGPSSPESPARSMQNSTGSFCKATSCTIASNPRCKKVE